MPKSKQNEISLNPGFYTGIFIFLLVLFLPAPAGLSLPAKKAAATALLMAVWWVSEAIPIAATALLPLVLFPFFSVMKAEEVARLYMDPNVFLFMGGFMIAIAMQKSGLEKRIALYLIRFVGRSPRRLLGGFMVATAFISMWVSNTATTIMMLPIALAVIGELHTPPGKKDPTGFSAALMLGVAYASSIGGVATLVGTPPNMIFVAQAKALFPQLPEVGFVQWFLFAFPLAAGFLVMAWVYLAFFTVRGALLEAPAAGNLIERQIASLGDWKKSEKRVMLIFILTVLAWITRADLKMGTILFRGWESIFHLSGMHDGTVAMLAALLLFILPGDQKGEFLLDWESAEKLPWGVLLLFGGGIALASGVQSSGFAAWLAGGFTHLKHIPMLPLLLLLSLITIFVSEFMSNTAQVLIMMPVLAAASKTLNVHPYMLMVPMTIATSLAFMMPAGTAPNAIIFGSGYVTIPQMAKTGFVLNILAILWVSFLSYLLMGPIFGLSFFR